MAKFRILVADDEAGIRTLVKEALGQLGHQADACADGGEALRHFDAAAYDLLVLDVMMPKRTGVEIVRELRARNFQTPVILMSSLLQEDVEQAVDGLPGVVVLQKPFSLDRFRKAVASVTGSISNGNGA